METITIEADSALFIKKGDKLVGLVHLDQKSHHNVFYKVELMSTEEIADFLKDKLTK